MTKSAIILAGGLGTRLRSAVPELPKCMAPVNGRPFLAFVIAHLRHQGINNFIFALGYKSEAFADFISSTIPRSQFVLSVEPEPLGTGGAIRLACNHARQESVLVANGDTLFMVDVPALTSFHQQQNADCTLALKPMVNFDRYGVVELNADGSVGLFREKQFFEKGLINGGVYALNPTRFLSEDLPAKFSFEKDYLEKYAGNRRIFGFVQNEYFIDIGIPEDYSRAQKELG